MLIPGLVIEREVLIEAPPKVVWRTITEPDQMSLCFADRVDLVVEPGAHGRMQFGDQGGTVNHCYSSYARGTEFLMGYYAILDRAPEGRNEGDQPMSWLRRHDEYHN